MTEHILHKSIYLRAAPATVWAFLTRPDQMKTWFHAPNVALTQDARFEMRKADDGSCFMSGRVLASTPYELLEYRFHIPQMGETTSTVRWELTEIASGTRLTLTHSGLPQAAEAFGLILALDKGWDGHLDAMRAALHDKVAA